MKMLAIESGGSYVDVATPSSYQTVREEIVKSSRNTLGNLYKYRINEKMTITAEWAVLSSEDKTALLNLTSSNQFNVRYFDLTDSTFKYGTFYRGAGYSVNPINRFSGEDFKWFTVSMELVEF